MPTQLDTLRNAGFSDAEVQAYLQRSKGQLAQAGFSEDEINSHFGTAKYDPLAMSKGVETYLSQDEPDSFWDNFLKAFEPSWAERRAKSYKAIVGAGATGLKPNKLESSLTGSFKAGYQQSVTGLIQRGKLPDNIFTDEAMRFMPTKERLALQTGVLAGDFPFMTMGAIFGGASGGPAAPLTAMGGAFALPAGLRQVYIDKYEKGEIQSFSEFWQRLGDAVMETLKGEAVGIATAAIGASVPGMASLPAEIATMTTLGAAMEGSIPEPKDFLDAAILIGGLRASTGIAGKLRRHWAQTGEHPYAIVEKMKDDPSLQAKFLEGDRVISSVVKDTEGNIYEAQTHHTAWDKLQKKGKTLDPEQADLFKTKSGRILEREEAAKYTGQESMDARDIVGKSLKKQEEKPADLMTAEEVVLSTIHKGKDKKRPYTLHDYYTDFIDKIHPLGRVTKALAGKEKLAAEKDPYILARNFAGSKGVGDHFLEFSPITFTQKKNIGKPLREILKPFRDNVDGFVAFIKSKRALELSKREIETGVPVEAAAEVVKNGSAKYDQAFKELQEYQDYVLRYMKDSGIFSAETFENIKELNKDYVPFYRFFDKSAVKGKGGAGKGLEAWDPIKKIRGSELQTIDPLESIIKNTYLFTSLAEKNRIGKTLVDLATKRQGIAQFVTRMPRKVRPVRISQEELINFFDKYSRIIKSVREKKSEKIETTKGGGVESAVSKVEGRVLEALQSRGWSEGEAQQIISRLKGAKDDAEVKTITREIVKEESERLLLNIPEEGLNIFRPNAFYPKPDQISVWINGKREVFKVHEDIARVFKDLDAESLSLLTKIGSIPTKLLRAGAILSPEFMARNPLRDQFAAFVYSAYGFIPGFNLARGISSLTRKDKYYQDWVKSGGVLSELVSLDRTYLQKGLGEVMAKYPVLNRIRYGTRPIELLRVLSELSEQGTRLGEFKKARMKGATLTEAGYASREVTLDFGRIGAKMRATNALIAFFNANLQGTDKLVRSFKDRPIPTTLRIAAGITLPSVLLTIANYDDPRWKEIPQWQKDLFWIIPTGNVNQEEWDNWTIDQKYEFNKEHTIWRCPKPFELGIIFGSVAERVTERILYGNKEAFNGVLETVSRGATPGMVPTLMVPFIENFANRSTFTDYPIIPANRENILPEYQYRPYTSDAAKAIGKLLGKLPPLKEKGFIAPAKIENLIRGWSGGLGMHVLNLASLGLRKAGLAEDKVKPAKVMADWPVIKAFVVRYPTAGTESIQKFFDSYTSTQTRLNTIRVLMQKEFNAYEAQKLMFGHEQEMVKIEGVQKGLQNALKSAEFIYNSPVFNKDEKRQLIDVTYFHMQEMAKHGNKLIKALEVAMKDQRGITE